ncbi:hypothetical protein B0I35DRAFT_162668 [Stachybotrys elegans]|uniref:CFEM domain-containing protein n=1 Tax=Stachybotrys elegans TaxID=80388 RepID=A0A8K0WUX6_9HYPO|nr:hypothetical protein B0I35DRAFT_162668 [Stachybotrys elegans]
MRTSFSLLGALIAASILGVSAQDGVPACVRTCSDQVRNERFGEIGCGSAGDAGCLCASPNFVFAIRDCSNPGCGGTEDNVRAYLQSSFCPNLAAAPAPAPSAPEEPAPPATTEAPPAAETSAPPPAPTSEAPQTTEAAPAPTETPATSAAPEETSASEAPSSTESSAAAASTEPTASGTSSAAAPTNTSSSSADGDSDSSEEGDDDQDDEDNGLPQAAIIGIGVGIGAAVLGALAVAFFLWRRRGAARHKNRPVFEISKPLPGAGRAYTTPDHASFEKYGDIEMTTRYEEMVPRTQPRTML